MWTYIIAGLGALAMLCAITYKVDAYLDEVKESGVTEERSRWQYASAQRREREADQSNKASQGLEQDRTTIQIRTRTITQYVDREVEKPVYRNICLPADGLCLANAALRGDGGKGADTCKPDAGVPAANRAG